MKTKNTLVILATILSLIAILCNLVYAAPVYINNVAQFPAFPYNIGAYKNAAGDYVGCGPTTGAMILAYFAHVYGASNLLTAPTPSTVAEGLATAWALHSSSYMKTHDHTDPPNNGFGSVYDIKPGLENYAKDRGYTIKVVMHTDTNEDPNNQDPVSGYNTYGAYGDAWMNDGNFWVYGGSPAHWYIDPQLFCDFISPKLSAGICIFLTVDAYSNGLPTGTPIGMGTHWVALVSVDKATNTYSCYDTWSTAERTSIPIKYCGYAPDDIYFSISRVRTVEYIPPVTVNQPPVALFTESAETAPVGTPITFDASSSMDPDGTIVSYAWDFGDSATASGVATSHAYTFPGTYTVTMTVTDNGGLTATATATKTILLTGVIPEVPLGTILASVPMILALAGYLAIPRWKRKAVV